MKNLTKCLTALLIFVAGTSQAATLRWDASTGTVDGYTVYFTDGTNTYNYDAGTATEVVDIDTTLNLVYGTTYTFIVRAYNSVGESGDSNSASYTTDPAPVYNPPVDSLPAGNVQNPDDPFNNSIIP